MTATALQLVLSGLGTGSIYALIALGFNVIFKSTGAINFGQGEWVMLGGMSAAALVAASLPVALACLAAVLIVAAVGVISERLVVAPLRQRTPVLITLITIGLSIATKSAVMLTLGKDPAGYPGFSGDATLHLLGASMPAQTLWIVGITLAFLVGAQLFFERTILGKALRATAADPVAATLMGVRVPRMITLSFGLGALAGGLAGILITPLTFTSYDQGTVMGFKGFSAAMLGGIGSLPGAVLGALVLGLTEALVAGYVSSQFKDAVAFLLLLLVLFIRPTGLIGRTAIERL
jgi:branched-chain amino acid transport system permease protein